MKKFLHTKKKLVFGNNRSKALNITKRNWKLNLKKYSFTENGQKKTIYLTVREIRTRQKKQASSNQK